MKIIPVKCCQFLLLIFLIVLLFSSCKTTQPIRLADFKAFTEIEKGDTAKLKWNITNADIVYIDKIPGEFSPNDSLDIIPGEDEKYIFKAVNDHDTINASWRIFVLAPESEPVRGPDETGSFNLGISEVKSEYLSGIKSTDSKPEPARLKITGMTYPKEKNDPATVRFIVLDSCGNFITGYPQHNTKLIVEGKCEYDSLSSEIDVFSEKEYMASDPGLNLNICLDVSSQARDPEGVLAGIADFTTALDKNDLVSLDYFNQRHLTLFQLLTPSSAEWQLSNTTPTQPSGLTGIYRTAYNSLALLGNSIYKQKPLLIIITFGKDNCSLIYSASDIASLAREYGIPVYIIGLGNSVDSYPLLSICSFSGGKFYYLANENRGELKEILKEIAYSNKMYYQVNVPVNSFLEKCSETRTGLIFKNDYSTFSDYYNLLLKPEILTSGYQALAAYGHSKTLFPSEYNDNAVSLAKVLTDNPGYTVQLIGYSSYEGDETKSAKIALQRVQNARKKLLELGAASNQVRIKYVADDNPIYYFRTYPWQEYQNRRVEVRWLNPELEPYEIIAEQTWSEEAALKKVEAWERRGFQSYYQRYIYQSYPVYRVKLWGYKTLKKAQQVSVGLAKKYKIAFTVE